MFASHVYFAIGDYRAAAREIDIATRIVPISHWGAIIRNADRLGSRQHYEAQLHQLHRYLDQNPTSEDARVVYGFYSAAMGERRVASDQFSIILNLQPRHELASRLSNGFTTREVSIGPGPSHQGQSNGSVLIRNTSSQYGREERFESGQDNRAVIQVNPGDSESVIIDDREGSVIIRDGTLIDLVP